MEMELVDLLNDRKEKTGEVCARNNVPEGKYRLSIHIWIVNDENKLLIQQRSSNRKMFPNKWTNTGGACVSGEESLDTVYRELKEELDVIPVKENLEFIASYKRKNDFVDVWVLHQNLNIEELKLQTEEVQAVKWVEIKEWEKLVEEGEGIKSSTDYFLKYFNNDF